MVAGWMRLSGPAGSRCGPQRLGGGLVFREIKERRRKTVALPPSWSACCVRTGGLRHASAWPPGTYGRTTTLSGARRTAGRTTHAPTGRNGRTSSSRPGSSTPERTQCRHSAATIAIHQGVALPVVQEMLGHSDIRVTRDYVDVSSPLAQDAANRVGRALFGVTVPKIVPKGSPQ